MEIFESFLIRLFVGLPTQEWSEVLAGGILHNLLHMGSVCSIGDSVSESGATAGADVPSLFRPLRFSEFAESHVIS